MRKQALLDSAQRQKAGTQRTIHMPAPTKGWNTRDPLASMSPEYAVQLDNFFPDIGAITLRQGLTTWGTRAAAGTIKTLLSFEANTAGTLKLFACTDNGIYDATAGGAIGVAASALTNGQVESVNITNSAGTNYLWCCNGTDNIKTYNGAAWADITGVSVPAITGVTVTNINFCWLFKRRIFMVEKNTMNAWFLPVDSIAGAASKFPVGPLFKLGGYLLCGGTFTVDSGYGPDDYCVFVTSEGEAAFYQGVDPSTSNSFSLQGVFNVGRPTTRRCLVKVGGDLCISTELGLIQLSKIIKGYEPGPSASLADAIWPTWTSAARAYATTFGWGMTLFPARNALICNVPSSPTTTTQYVMNTLTGAWCRFQNWDSQCFVVHNSELYAGGLNGIVYKAWSGAKDLLASPIIAQCLQAFSTMGVGGRPFQVKLARPIVQLNGGVELQMAIFTDLAFGNYVTTIPADGTIVSSPWDSSPWDTSPWSSAGNAVTKIYWRHIPCRMGFYAALALQFTSSNATLAAWPGTDFELETGVGM